tara:strand:- start:686 stop:907 length:222 start_codon:yes stop_codon:yes gene_type:complete
MKELRIIIPIMGFVLLCHELFISNAYAYIDPGSGSVIFQVIIGTLVGLGIALKIYWEKLKMKFSMLSRKSDDE